MTLLSTEIVRKVAAELARRGRRTIKFETAAGVFEKTPEELMAYDYPITSILEDDAVMLIAEEEDRQLIRELVGVGK